MLERDVPPRFAIAFSLAGEQRDLVLAVAQEVEAVLGRSTVFYDSWYEHWIAGQDADLLLQNLYTSRSDLVVVCVSDAYGMKPWTQAEHRAIRARLWRTPSARSQVLPVRVGSGEVEGILSNEIVPDLRDRSVVEAANLIIARLNLARGVPAGQDESRSWPSQPPQLIWPMADHDEARAAFAQLLRGSSEQRVLLVKGASETGKSHMSRQMARNALALPGVACGRFDFKGTSNMDVEFEAFAQPLGVDAPRGSTLNERLGRLFTTLRGLARPTVLIFDTFEVAGEARDLIERVILPQAAGAPWLRLVLTGQEVPRRIDTTWESVALPALCLRLPSPEHWLKYGLQSRGEQADFDLKFVSQVHELSQGRASLLASLFGPTA